MHCADDVFLLQLSFESRGLLNQSKIQENRPNMIRKSPTKSTKNLKYEDTAINQSEEIAVVINYTQNTDFVYDSLFGMKITLKRTTVYESISVSCLSFLRWTVCKLFSLEQYKVKSKARTFQKDLIFAFLLLRKQVALCF